jgi:glutaredoxin 3
LQHVTIYTKENCSYCTKAKMLLANRGIRYNELKLNEDFTREALVELFPSAMTFPVIVVDGFNIGGFTELNKMLTEQTNTSAKLLTEGEWNGA